ncbi:hypothetical protein NDU88_002474 [Pleurodeles waltl]|uniref:Uncharacterized protein n=1 Tax=Pleurodeles waltl TaxID=8319 RepID=A0AAV7VZR9_PLEWA|nr:hypothetical protein NDU88_002474 [Pleurodeles waltl]
MSDVGRAPRTDGRPTLWLRPSGGRRCGPDESVGHGPMTEWMSATEDREGEEPAPFDSPEETGACAAVTQCACALEVTGARGDCPHSGDQG